MSRKDELPRVFADGSATLCVTQGAFRLYVGQTEIRLAERIGLSASRGASLPLVEVEFPADGSSEENLAVEEEIRACRTVAWIRATR
jgi:hypothetical protein